jgi:hypothetical protein
LIWPGYQGGGAVGFRPDLQAFEIVSESERLVQLGTLDNRAWRIGVDLEQPVWAGAVGIFLGYHEIESKNGRIAQMQLINGGPMGLGGDRPSYRIERSVLQISPEFRFPVTVKSISSAEIPWPENSRSLRLEVELQDSHAVRISWGREILTTLAQDELRVDEADFAGPWGIYSHRCTTWVRHPAQQLLKDLPK